MDAFTNTTRPQPPDKSEGCALCKRSETKSEILFAITGKGALCSTCLFKHEHPDLIANL